MSRNLNLVSPYAMVRDRWPGTPYGQQVLPGEWGPGRGLLRLTRRGRGNCVRVPFAEVLAEYRAFDRVHGVDPDAAAGLARRALVYARKLRDTAPEPGLRELGAWLVDHLATTPVAVWPPGRDWELPFTVGGGIVWPHFLCADTSEAAQTLVHEMVHVAQAQLDQLPLFGQWMDANVVRRFGYVRLDGIPVGRPACDWLNDYRAQNHTTESDSEPEPTWWTHAIQNPDTLGIPYGVRVRDGDGDPTLYLPWLARAGGGTRMTTWMLPLAWHHALGRHYIAKREPIDGGLPGPHAALLARFGGCHQFDHPHEIAAHHVVDFLRGKSTGDTQK